MCNIDKKLFENVQEDVERYLNKDGEDMPEKAFLYIYFVLTNGMRGFLGSVINDLKQVKHSYNDYLKVVVSSLSKRFNKYKAYYDLPRNVQAEVVPQVLTRMWTELKRSDVSQSMYQQTQ